MADQEYCDCQPTSGGCSGEKNPAISGLRHAHPLIDLSVNYESSSGAYGESTEA